MSHHSVDLVSHRLHGDYQESVIYPVAWKTNVHGCHFSPLGPVVKADDFSVLIRDSAMEGGTTNPFLTSVNLDGSSTALSPNVVRSPASSLGFALLGTIGSRVVGLVGLIGFAGLVGLLGLVGFVPCPIVGSHSGDSAASFSDRFSNRRL